jgi:hypothetical protein
MSVEIRQIPLGGNLKDFLNVVDYIYRDDPAYVRPLDLDVKGRFNPKNAFFEHAEGTAFAAYRNGWCVGRCSAQIDREHLGRYRDDTGFFGFIDTIEDGEVCTALLAAAKDWLRQRGMKRALGPFSLSINQELGCLIDGFDTPPMVLMPHHRPYQGGLVEQAGFTKSKDLYAWRYVVGEVSARAKRAHAEIEALPEVSSRHVDPKQVDRDIRIVMDVFNDGWSDNWNFVPFTEAELREFAKELKLILIPELTYITTIDGEPAAVAIALPNINELIGDLNGKLLPFGLAKLLFRLKVRGPTTARLAILGIRKKFRGVRKYAGLSTYMYTAMNRNGQRIGVRSGELSWTLEDNAPVNVGIKFMGGKIYKTYRLYEATL